MQCERCHEREAVVTITQIIEQQQKKMYLCERCASEVENKFMSSSTFEKFLSGFLSDNKINEQLEIIKCNNCGMTLTEIKKSSKMGCANCYTTFNNYLLPVFKRIHGNTQHNGKKPKRLMEELETINELSVLQKQLEMAILKEEYEEAAKLRDQIRAIKKEVSNE